MSVLRAQNNILGLQYMWLLDNTAFLHHAAHGTIQLPNNRNVKRFCFTVNDEKIFDYTRKDFSSVPGWYEDMQPWYENNSSLAELSLAGSVKIRSMTMIACESLTPGWYATAEMFGMFNDTNVDDAPFCEQIYHGWAVKVPEYDTLNLLGLHPDAFISDWYRYMDSGFTAARARDMSSDADKAHRKEFKTQWRHVGNADNWRFRWFY